MNIEWLLTEILKMIYWVKWRIIKIHLETLLKKTVVLISLVEFLYEKWTGFFFYFIAKTLLLNSVKTKNSAYKFIWLVCQLFNWGSKKLFVQLLLSSVLLKKKIYLKLVMTRTQLGIKTN